MVKNFETGWKFIVELISLNEKTSFLTYLAGLMKNIRAD